MYGPVTESGSVYVPGRLCTMTLLQARSSVDWIRLETYCFVLQAVPAVGQSFGSLPLVGTKCVRFAVSGSRAHAPAHSARARTAASSLEERFSGSLWFSPTL